ncbi:flagellin [uncultured Arcobacter sp.]|uniref:flagellin N-terminal helical domain-containing protein n=1 Tax=uncultured Arcobacter sp. TaxID=165434 RepID=UPI00262234AD|nr:flagellin [uncultured Arcobacter sp.]
MKINTNIASLNAQEAATKTNSKIASSLEKLSTGLKVNKASDDASGLAIADKLRTQATSIGQGIDNGNSAVALIQIADKSMAEQSNILDIVKSKLIQANTDTTSPDGREAIRKDIVKLLEQLDNIAQQTSYNGITLLQDSYDSMQSSRELSFQIGGNKDDIMQSSYIQSNTIGLGGGTEAIDQVSGSSTRGNLISQGLSTIVSADGTNAITLDGYATGTAIDVNISGITSEITFNTSSGTISNVDTNTQLILESLANISTTTAVSGGKVKFTRVAADGTETNLTVAQAKVFTAASGTLKATVKVSDINGNVLGDFSISTSGGAAGISSAITINAGTIVNGIQENPSFSVSTGTTIDLGGNAINTLAIGSTIDTYSVGAMTIEQSSASGSITFGANAQNLMIQNNNDQVGEELKLTTGVNNDGATGTIYGGGSLSGLKALATGQLTKVQADKYQSIVDAALSQMNIYRSDLGSTQNQIESAVRNLMTQETNVKAAESVIRDVDYAEESANFNKNNIISQAGSYAMSQANSVQQNVLRLLQ